MKRRRIPKTGIKLTSHNWFDKKGWLLANEQKCLLPITTAKTPANTYQYKLPLFSTYTAL